MRMGVISMINPSFPMDGFFRSRKYQVFFFGSGGSRRNDLIRSTPLVIKQGEFSSIDRNDFPMKTFVYFDFILSSWHTGLPGGYTIAGL